MPKFSFITPCYNDAKFIGRFVDSIIDQDYTDWELIIVNDGSTDDSKIIIDALTQKDKRVTAIHLKKNKGACVARNTGAKKAKGEIYSFLPADAFLYPGVLRTWIEQLDEYPDYDFVYGGYRVTDEDFEPIPNGDYLFNSFDPYLLEVTNYIDGSFPIRAKCFWDIAKLMKQPDGLWDSNIKSLQDWDFWLSVVKDGKRKGIYIQDIFFETTAPHEGGLSFDSHHHWLERLDQIKAKHNIPIRRLCVSSLGATFHGKKLSYILNADFLEMPSRRENHYDAIYSIGFYPEFAKMQDSIFLADFYDDKKGRTPAKKIVHFIGTDIWQLRKISLEGLDIWKSYFKNGIDEILVEAEFTQKEIEEVLGIKAKIVPIPPAKLYDVMKLPEKFTVACYMPQTNSNFYLPEVMEEVAKLMPDVEFKFFGNHNSVGRHQKIKNIENVGYINLMEDFIKECSAIMRFPIHDGLPISVLEFILAGRYATTNVPIEQAYMVPNSDKDSIVESLRTIQERIKKEGENQVGSDYWRKELNHDLYRERIFKLTGYNPEEYWQNRAESWIKQSDNMLVEEKQIEPFYKKVNPKTVLDVGAGSGRWIPILEKWGMKKKGYTGFDISEKLIRECGVRFPRYRFYVGDVLKTKIPKKKYDLVFIYTTLEHVLEKDIKAVVTRLKKVGNKLLLIEPTNFNSKYYCRSHDYDKLFKVIKKKKLKDKTIYLCDLSQ